MRGRSECKAPFVWLYPFAAWLPRVTLADLKADLPAALTGAVVVLPQGVAFATIAGMPPQYGLYAGMVPAIVAALFGSSRHLVSGPTTAASVVLFSSLSLLAVPGTPDYVALALTLTLMVGVLELALGLARMGALVNFISHSVVVGFTAGAAVLIAVKQLKHFFGVSLDSGGHVHDILVRFFGQVADINPYATVVAVATLAAGIVVRRFLPRIPYMLAAMLVGGLTAVVLDTMLGPEVARIETVPALPASLPPLSAPALSLDHIRVLAPAALAVTLFALTEAVSIGRALGARGGYRIDGNQEFIGQGLSNIAGAFFSGYVATGSFNRSAVNYEAGARTPLAAVLAGVLLMLVVLFVAPLASYLPKPTMAAVLFLVAWGLIDRAEIRHIIKASGRETGVLAVTFFSALFLDLEFAIFAGVLLSLVLYLERTSKPRLVTVAPDERLRKRAFSSDPTTAQCPQLRFLRVDGSLFFGAIPHLERYLGRLRQTQPEQKHLAVIADGINFVDMQGAEALAKEARRRRADGGDFYMINVKQGVREALARYGCLGTEGVHHLFDSKEAAIEGIFRGLDRSVCAACTKRIFRECGELPPSV